MNTFIIRAIHSRSKYITLAKKRTRQTYSNPSYVHDEPTPTTIVKGINGIASRSEYETEENVDVRDKDVEKDKDNGQLQAVAEEKGNLSSCSDSSNNSSRYNCGGKIVAFDAISDPEQVEMDETFHRSLHDIESRISGSTRSLQNSETMLSHSSVQEFDDKERGDEHEEVRDDRVEEHDGNIPTEDTTHAAQDSEIDAMNKEINVNEMETADTQRELGVDQNDPVVNQSKSVQPNVDRSSVGLNRVGILSSKSVHKKMDNHKPVAAQTSDASVKNEREARESRQQAQLTVMLLVVTFAFLLLTLPQYVRYIMFSFLNITRDEETFAFATLFYHLSNKLFYTNSSVNFYLYCIAGSKFRNDLRFLLVKYFRIHKLQKKMDSTSTDSDN